MNMKTFNSFESLYNEQPLTGNYDEFAGWSENTNEQPLIDGTENAYSEQEQKQRVAKCQKEIQEAQREMQQIAHLFKIMNDPRKRKMHRLDMPAPLTPAQQCEKKDRYKELDIRAEALDKRIQQIMDSAPTAQFVVMCQAIEDKLEKFQSQLGQIVDKPAAAQTQQYGTSNISFHQLFQD